MLTFLRLALGTHSVVIAVGYAHARLALSPASSILAICDAGHEAVAERI